MSRSSACWSLAYRMLLPLALLAGVACTTASVPGPVTDQRPEAADWTTVIIVRHAERDPGADPPLNAEGQARAQALAAVLADAGVEAIYCTDLIRNRDTARPLANRLGLTPNVIGEDRYADTPGVVAELLREILTTHAGGTVLFIGNTGSSRFPQAPGVNQELFRRLGGAGAAPTRYQDLYVVHVPPTGKPRVVRATYGGRSSLDAS